MNATRIMLTLVATVVFAVVPTAAVAGGVDVSKSPPFWTFVAPPLSLLPGERTGTFRIGPGVVMRDADGQNAVSMEDLAVAIINEIEEPQFIRSPMTAAY